MQMPTSIVMMGNQIEGRRRLSKDVAGHLEECVRQEEDGQGQTVLSARELELFLKTVEASVADCAAIQERQEV